MLAIYIGSKLSLSQSRGSFLYLSTAEPWWSAPLNTLSLFPPPWLLYSILVLNLARLNLVELSFYFSPAVGKRPPEHNLLTPAPLLATVYIGTKFSPSPSRGPILISHTCRAWVERPLEHTVRCRCGWLTAWFGPRLLTITT